MFTNKYFLDKENRKNIAITIKMNKIVINDDFELKIKSQLDNFNEKKKINNAQTLKY